MFPMKQVELAPAQRLLLAHKRSSVNWKKCFFFLMEAECLGE